jgi:hypothetical protein
MYLDPGFGGMLLQAVVAIVAVGGAIVFSFRRKIKELFTKNKKSDGKQQGQPDVNIAESQDDAIDMLDDKE